MFNRPLGPFAILYEKQPAQVVLTKLQLRKQANYQRQKLMVKASRVNPDMRDYTSQEDRNRNLAIAGKSVFQGCTR